MFHVLPPSLAWLWRLVAPRGHGNPSIVDTGGMSSEGVGSYWPFATGRRVDQANILLHQILNTPDTLFVLIPNQHVGCWSTGFAPQWIAREYLSRRGSSPFAADKLVASRCPLLGRGLETIHVEGQTIGHWFLQVETQPEVGTEGYDRGADILGEDRQRAIVGFFACARCCVLVTSAKLSGHHRRRVSCYQVASCQAVLLTLRPVYSSSPG